MKTPTHQIPCPVCKKGGLYPRKKLRYGGVGATIGIFFFVPSTIALIAFFKTIGEMNATTDGELAAVGAIGIFGLLPAFLFFLLGLFLCRSVKILKCGYCNATQDAY